MKKTLRKMVGMLVVAASIVSMVSVQDVSASQTTQTSYETLERKNWLIKPLFSRMDIQE